MGSGCYDLDGKCINCGGYAPCDCEIVDPDDFDYEADEDEGN